MEVGLTIPENVLVKLTKQELSALEKYHDKPDLALSVQTQFFELFLNGSTLSEIHRLNSNFPFGAIVRARISGQWDARKDQVAQHALDSVRQRIEQTQVSAVNFNADLLQAAHKQFGDRLKKYLQTGDESVLGDLRIDSLKQYKDAIEMWLKLTGQESKGRTVEATNVGIPKVAERALTSEEADAIFSNLLAKEPK